MFSQIKKKKKTAKHFFSQFSSQRWSQRLVIGRSLVRFPCSACWSVLGQDTEPQTAPDVLVAFSSKHGQKVCDLKRLLVVQRIVGHNRQKNLLPCIFAKGHSRHISVTLLWHTSYRTWQHVSWNANECGGVSAGTHRWSHDGAVFKTQWRSSSHIQQGMILWLVAIVQKNVTYSHWKDIKWKK